MKKKKKVRIYSISVMLTPEEKAQLMANFKATVFPSLSQYMRAMLFSKPVTLFYRSRSLDEFVTVATGIRDQLDVISRNWYRVTKTLQDQPPETTIAETLTKLLSAQLSLFQDVGAIKSLLYKIYEDEIKIQDMRRNE